MHRPSINAVEREVSLWLSDTFNENNCTFPDQPDIARAAAKLNTIYHTCTCAMYSRAKVYYEYEHFSINSIYNICVCDLFLQKNAAGYIAA